MDETKKYCELLPKNNYKCNKINCGSFNCAFKININNKKEYVMKIGSKMHLNYYIQNIIPKHILFDLIFCVYKYDEKLKKYKYEILNDEIDNNFYDLLLSKINIDSTNIEYNDLTIEKYITNNIFHINNFNTYERLKYTLLFLLDSLIQIKYINNYNDFKPDNILFEYNNNITRDMFKIIDYSKGSSTEVFQDIINPNNNIYYDIIKNNFNKYNLYTKNKIDNNLLNYNYYDYHCILYSVYLLINKKQDYSDDNIIIYFQYIKNILDIDEENIKNGGDDEYNNFKNNIKPKILNNINNEIVYLKLSLFSIEKNISKLLKEIIDEIIVSFFNITNYFKRNKNNIENHINNYINKNFNNDDIKNIIIDIIKIIDLNNYILNLYNDKKKYDKYKEIKFNDKIIYEKYNQDKMVDIFYKLYNTYIKKYIRNINNKEDEINVILMSNIFNINDNDIKNINNNITNITNNPIKNYINDLKNKIIEFKKDEVYDNVKKYIEHYINFDKNLNSLNFNKKNLIDFKLLYNNFLKINDDEYFKNINIILYIHELLKYIINNIYIYDKKNFKIILNPYYNSNFIKDIHILCLKIYSSSIYLKSDIDKKNNYNIGVELINEIYQNNYINENDINKIMKENYKDILDIYNEYKNKNLKYINEKKLYILNLFDIKIYKNNKFVKDINFYIK